MLYNVITTKNSKIIAIFCLSYDIIKKEECMELSSIIISSTIGGLTLIWAVVSAFIIHLQNKKIENLKMKNENYTHITKVQFDTEFRIYEQLSASLFKAVTTCSELFPYGIDQVPSDEKEKFSLFKQRYKIAAEASNSLTEDLQKYAPFIKESIYNNFQELSMKCSSQIIWYPVLVLKPNKNMNRIDREFECMKRTEEISVDLDKLVKHLREYLSDLKVI